MKRIVELNSIFSIFILLAFTFVAFGQTPTSNVDKKRQADRIFEEAYSLFRQGTAESYKRALPKFQETSRLYQEINDKSENAGVSLLALGLISDKLGEKFPALRFYDQALLFFRYTKNIFLEATTLNSIGLTYSSLGESQKALEFYNQSLPLFIQVGDISGQARALNNIAGVYNLLGEKQLALKFLNEALPLIIKDGNISGQGTTLNNIGVIYTTLGEKQKALEFFYQALPLRTKAGDFGGQAGTLNNIGKIYDSMGENQKALEFYNQALSVFIKVEDLRGHATTLNNIGSVYQSLGENQKALEFLNKALAISIKIGDIGGQAGSLNIIGGIYSVFGENQKALEFYNRALQIFIKVGDVGGQAGTLGIIGKIYNVFGEKQKALEFYNKALLLHIKVGDVGNQARQFVNIGLVYSDLGEKRKALEFYNQASPLYIKVGDVDGQAGVLYSIGRAYHDLGEKQKALEFFKQSLPLYIKVGDVNGQAGVLNSIGNVHSVLSEKQKALEFYNQALQLSVKANLISGQASILNNIGMVYSDLGEKQKALEFYSQANQILIRVGDVDGQANTFNNLMLGSWELYKDRLAIFYGKQAVNKIQQIRENISILDKENQKTYLSSIKFTHRNLSEIFIAQGRFSEAQQVLNLFKDQQFFDFNRNPNDPIKQLNQTPRENEFSQLYQQSSHQIGKFGSELDELKRKIGKRQPTAEEATQLQKIEADLKTANDNFLAVLKQAENEFSKLADEKDKIGDIPDTREMQTALRTLNQQTGQKTVAIYTLVGKDNFRALIVSPDGIKAVSSPIKATELNDKALKLWSILQSPNYDTTVLSKQIYDKVFKPIEAALPKDTTTIMWSLDGNLRYIPMAALWDGKQFLAERYNHVIFTRADAGRMTRDVNPNWSGTGFGTSQAKTVDLFGDGSKINFVSLLGVKQELQSIFVPDEKGKTIVSGDILSDDQFTKDKFYEALKKRRPLVHISSHFSFRPGDEARSFLLIGDGSALTLNELKKKTDLFQGVDLLTLSACNTAATQSDANGREIDGFAELAQRLGAGAVMATLWQVSDASTPWLMREFYAIKQSKDGMTKAEALKKAQLSLLNGTAEVKPLPNVVKSQSQNQVQVVIVQKGSQEKTDKTRSDVIYLDENEAPPYKGEGKHKYAHPYYWSPFVLYGNWK